MKVSEAIPGTKVGRLQILSILETRNKHGKLLANCLCDCGNIIISTINNIGNKTTSCGCYKVEKIIQRFGKSGHYNISAKVLSDVKRFNRDTDLTIDDISDLIFSDCFYCKKSLQEVGLINYTRNSSKQAIKRIGIDRVDNNLGYYKYNVVSSCKMCNYIKNSFSIDYILTYFPIIKNNSQKLLQTSFIPNNNCHIVIEHIFNCQCFSNKNFSTLLEDRVVKQVMSKSLASNHIVKIDNDFIKNIIYSPNCFYCERSIEEVGSLSKRNGYSKNLCYIRRFGLDRIDSNTGYIKNNIVPCCQYCNRMKNKYSILNLISCVDGIFQEIVTKY